MTVTDQLHTSSPADMSDFANAHRARFPTKTVVPAITTKSGLILSVQASDYHYCSPREMGAKRYDSFEVWWFGGPMPEELAPFTAGEDPASWVPADVVNALIRRLGGPV